MKEYISKKLILYKILAILLIMFGFEWFDIIQPLIQHFFGITSVFVIAVYSLPITLCLVICGIRLFDSTYPNSLNRPIGATIIGAIFIWSATIIFDILKGLHWSETIFIWDVHLEGLSALVIVLSIFAFSLFLGVGFLRLKLWSWWLCMLFVIFNVAGSVVGQYHFIKSDGISEIHKAIGSAQIGKEVILNTHISTLIFTVTLFSLLILYLLIIKHSFNK